MSGVLRVELSWPSPHLSPNRQQHYMVLHRYRKAAKTEAAWATTHALSTNHDWEPAGEKVKVHLVAHPPKNWSTGDADNLVARCKGALDGIANALEVNDSIFEAPTVTWADKCERGKLFVELS